MRRLLAIGVLVTTLAGCGTAGGTTASPAPTADGAPTGTVTVFAAASLTDVFTDLGAVLEDQQPGLRVQFSFAGSSALAAQLAQGAPADVFASADQAQMAVVTGAELADGEPAVFARNELEIAVPAGNPGGVTGLANFADPDLTLAVCAPTVPCGAAAGAVFAAAGITARPDTEEEDVRAALTKVQLGEVDAALVYATDVRAAGDAVEGIPFPESARQLNEYPICALAAAPDPAGAQAFVDLVRSAVGQRALADAGFRSP
ncbi:molybdate ABC transporter substrate-binding protein [Modestobacter sp. I12A-02662]|uniref:molybdate ABC transporter substrate-binding protein n=1 Tax=Modestobacter sp. I12A-02662 TaxID=1730496 RepID=UPI0034DE4B0B